MVWLSHSFFPQLGEFKNFHTKFHVSICHIFSADENRGFHSGTSASIKTL